MPISGRADDAPAKLPKLEMHDFDAYRKAGTATVDGAMRFDTKLLGGVRARNKTVFLMPATDYTRAVADAYRATTGSGAHLSVPGAVVRFFKAARTDENGAFSFAHVADGSYLLVAQFGLKAATHQSPCITPVDAFTPDGRAIEERAPAYCSTGVRYESIFAQGAVTVSAGAVTSQSFAPVDDVITNVEPEDATYVEQPQAPSIARSDVAPYAAKGTASLSGRIVLQLPRMKVKVFGGAPVQVWPLVPFTNFVVDYESRFIEWHANPRIDDDEMNVFESVVRKTTTDDEGYWKIDGLPPGRYVVAVRVSSTEPRTVTVPDVVREFVGESPLGEPLFDDVDESRPEVEMCHAVGFAAGIADAAASADTDAPVGFVHTVHDHC